MKKIQYGYLICTLLISAFMITQTDEASAQTAQSTGTTLQNLNANSNQPVDIESDKMEIFDSRGEAIFTGNVRATRGNILITGEKMTVRYNTEPNNNQNTFKVLHIKVENNTEMTVDNQNVKSKWAEMNVQENHITFGGGVNMTNGSVSLKGKELYVDLKNGDTRLIGSRVRGQFSP